MLDKENEGRMNNLPDTPIARIIMVILLGQLESLARRITPETPIEPLMDLYEAIETSNALIHSTYIHRGLVDSYSNEDFLSDAYKVIKGTQYIEQEIDNRLHEE